MKGVGLGLRFRVEYSLCWVPRQGIFSWAEGKPHKILLDMGLDILQIMLMSCPIPCMVLSWALGSLGSMGTSIGNECIILFHIYTCRKKYIHNGHTLRHGNIYEI
jgi:hypothetical protein